MLFRKLPYCIQVQNTVVQYLSTEALYLQTSVSTLNSGRGPKNVSNFTLFNIFPL